MQQVLAQGHRFGLRLYQFDFDLSKLGIDDFQSLSMGGSGPVGGLAHAQFDGEKP